MEHRLLHTPSQQTIKGTIAGTMSLAVAQIQKTTNSADMIINEFPVLNGHNSPSNTAKPPLRHHIETTGPPVFARTRRLSPEKLRAAQSEFDEMLSQGIIRPSKSACASPIHMVPKTTPSNCAWRICGDYSQLNEATKPDRYPVPHCQDFHFKLHGKKIFSKVDSGGTERY